MSETRAHLTEHALVDVSLEVAAALLDSPLAIRTADHLVDVATKRPDVRPAGLRRGVHPDEVARRDRLVAVELDPGVAYRVRVTGKHLAEIHRSLNPGRAGWQPLRLHCFLDHGVSKP